MAPLLDADPMNWKGGGSVHIGEMTYYVNPAVVRQPAPKTPGGGCSTSWDALYDQVWIWGNGWSGYDLRSRPNSKVAHCYQIHSTSRMGLAAMAANGLSQPVRVSSRRNASLMLSRPQEGLKFRALELAEHVRLATRIRR